MFKKKETEGDTTKDFLFQPIVYVNKPISKTSQDVVGFAPQVDTLKCAIDNGANMIALVADYGAGKSSITDLLCTKLCAKPSQYPNPIRINMWDFLKKETICSDDSTIVSGEVSSLTKAFLFQLANGKNARFASYINKRLSKNYGTISFGTNSKRIWVSFVIAGLLYSVSQVFSRQEISFINNAAENAKSILMAVQDCAPLFLVSALACVIWGLGNTCIAFSHWKMQNSKESEVNDIFDVYMTIIEKLKPKAKKKQIIIIEDLDRIAEKTVVVGFLKELYRFESTWKDRNFSKVKGDFVFIVSLKPEALLQETKGKAVIDDGQVYSKLFDATFSLKPVHFEDYDALLLMLIQSDAQKKQELEKLIDEPIGEVLPDSFHWIRRGTNLTLRTLKDRLNQAISIMVSLKNKRYQVKSAITFKACAAVAYLENQYPKDYYELIQSEQNFGKIISESYGIKNNKNLSVIEKGEQLKQLILEKQASNTNQTDKVPSKGLELTEEFKEALSELIISGVFDDDFRMYFYTYPKGSHIKTTEEKELYNFLLLPTQYTDYTVLNEIVPKVYVNGEDNVITQTIGKLNHYPVVILKNDILMRVAYCRSADAVYETFSEKYIKTLTSGEFNADDCTEVILRLKRVEISNKQDFINRVCKGVMSAANDSGQIIDFRKSVLKAYTDCSIDFEPLFCTTGVSLPQMTTAEIELIDNSATAIKLVNLEGLAAENFSYVCALLNSENQYQKFDNIPYERAILIYLEYIKIMSAKEIAPKILEFLRVNKSVENEFFSIITANITDQDAICDYLNSLECSELTPEYIEEIDAYGFTEGLSEDVLNKLSETQKYFSLLLCRAKNKSLYKIDFEDENVSKYVLQTCPKIENRNESAFIEIRKYIYESTKINAYSSLFAGDYPLITAEEYTCACSTAEAIQRINTKLQLGQNVAELSAMIALRKYSTKDTLLLFQHLFDESFNENCITDQTTAWELIWELDYTKVQISQLNLEQQEKIAAILSDAAGLSGAEDAVRYLEMTKCLIPSLERIIAANGGYDKDYLELIKSLDECTQATLEWFDIVRIDWLGKTIEKTGLPNNICESLKTSERYHAYVLGNMLRENNMIIKKDIRFDVYYDIYTKVDAAFNIMSNHWDFLEQLQIRNLFEGLDAKHLQPIYKVKQHVEFFAFVLGSANEERKKQYLLEFGELATANASKEFETLVCAPEIIELIGTRKMFDYIRERLWGDTSHKRIFTKKWNDRWKKELEEQERIIL